MRNSLVPTILEHPPPPPHTLAVYTTANMKSELASFD